MVFCWLGLLNLLGFLGWDVTFGGLTENREFGYGNLNIGFSFHTFDNNYLYVLNLTTNNVYLINLS
jgi:hypothetical protein